MRRAVRACLIALVVVSAATLAGRPAGVREPSGAWSLRAAEESSPVTIGVVGDTIFGHTPVLPGHPARYLKAVTAQLAAADVTFANLEGTLTTATRSKCSPGSSLCFAFRNPPRFAQYLKNGGIDI